MAGIMALAFVIALLTLRRGVQDESVGDAEAETGSPVASVKQ
jgi:hypothetical protein